MHGFSLHFKSTATFFTEECKWKKKLFGRRKGGICGVRTQRRSHHHHTGQVHVLTSGCGHATFGFRRAPATAWTWWCILANKGFTNLAIVTKFSPFPRTVRQRQNDDLRFCLPCWKCEWWGRRERAPVNLLKESFADEETCRDWYTYHIEHAGWWLDQRVAILADQTFCSDELDDQLLSLLCQLIHQQ